MVVLREDVSYRRLAAAGATAVAVLAAWIATSSAFALTYQSQWGGNGPGAFSQPHGVASDGSNIFVTDRTTDELQVFDSGGNFITRWGGSGSATGQFSSPDGVAVDPSGMSVYVADFGNNRIQKFDAAGGAFLNVFGSNGSAEGQFSGPEAVAVDSSGNVYVAELFNDRIQKFNSSGTFHRMWGWGVDDGSNAFQTCTSGCQAGISGDGDGQFHGPVGLATDSSNNVYVMDESNHRVQEFDSSGAFTRMWGWGVDDGTSALQTCTSSCQAGLPGSGDGQFFNPETGIDVTSGGHVYVADQGNERVQEFDASNPSVSFVNKFGSAGQSDGQFNSPEGLAVGSGGNVYVADYSNSRMQQFTSGGTFVRKWGHFAGTGDGELTEPRGAATGPGGTVYVSDYGNNRIERFDASGNFVRAWGWGVADGSSAPETCTDNCRAGLAGSGDGQFSNPEGLATNSAGRVYVVESANNRVQEFTSAGTFIRKWGANGGDGTSGSGNGEFSNPNGIAVSPTGNVYVADTNNGRIQEFTPTGAFIRKWGTFGSGNGEFGNLTGVATDPTGNVYAVDAGNAVVQKFTSTGTFLRKWGTPGANPGQFSIPSGAATDASGNVYVTDSGNNRIQKFTPNGVFAGLFGSSGTGNGQFHSPWGIATISSAGNIYVVDSGNDRVQKLSEDMTPPSGARISGTYPAFRTAAPFTVSWTGATDSGSGIKNYMAYAGRAPFNGPFGGPALFKTTLGPGSGSFNAKPGNTYCFTVKAKDNSGNVSAASPPKCTAMPVDDAALSGAGWTRAKGQAGFYQGTYSSSLTNGATLTRTGVQAKRIALVATKCPTCGAVEVRMGGTLLKKVNLASATTQKKQLMPVASFPGVVSGTVTVTVATSGKPVFIDGLGVSRN